MLRLLIVALLGLLPTLSWSMGVGDIEVDSTLNAPLDARIPLTALRAGEIEQIRVNVASNEAFRRVGLERSRFILGLEFEVVPGERPDSGVILVTSRRAAREPFISFLLEINSGSSRVLREYTLLLDPAEIRVAERQAEPVVTPPATVAPTRAPAAAAPAPPTAVPVQKTPAEPAAPVTAQIDVAEEQGVAVPAPEVKYANEPLPRADKAAPAPAPTTAPVGTGFAGKAVYGPVSEQETLWRIGTTVRPDAGITMDQVMWALYDKNRDQFDGDINHIRAGAMLAVPSRKQMLAVAPAEATRLVRSGKPTTVAKAEPTVIPVPKPKPGPAQVAATPAPTVVPTPEAPIAEEPAEVVEEDAFAALDELAQEDVAEPMAVAEESAVLEEELTPEEIEAAPDAFAEDADEPAVDDAFAEGPEAEEVPMSDESALDDPFAELDQLTDGETVEDLEEQAAEAEMAEADTQAQPQQAEPQGLAPPPAPAGETESFMDRTVAVGPVELPLLWLVAGGGLLLALLGGAAALQRGKKAGAKPARAKKAPKVVEPAKDPEPVEDAPEPEEPVDEMAAAGVVDEEPAVVPEPEVGIDLAEDTEGEPEVPETADLPAEPEDLGGADKTQILEAPIEAEAPPPEPVEPEHVGTETVSLELSEDPLSEADFHIAYGLYDEAAVLLTQAIETDPDRLELREKLAETYFASGNAAEFEKTARELKELGLEAGAWQKLVILGQQICPDSDLFAGDASEAAAGVDMDLGGSEGGADLDFSLDDDLESESTPVEEAADEGEISLDDSLEFDLDELEVPGDEPTAAADDGNLMDFDVDDLEVPEAPAEQEPVRDDSNLMEFDVGELETPEAPAEDKPVRDAGNVVEFDLGTEEQSDSELSLDDISLDDLEPDADNALSDGGDLGEFDMSDDSAAADSPLSDGDEMATKLDLARAYVDMGEGDMARSLLDDVLADGDAAQKADAQALIDKLG